MKLIKMYSRDGSYDRCWYKERVYFRTHKLIQHGFKVTLDYYVETHNKKHVYSVVPNHQLYAVRAKIQKLYDKKVSS